VDKFRGTEKLRKPKPNLAVELSGFTLSAPTMLASGVLGISFELFPRIVSSGCGAIVTKSIGVEPREGYRNPTMTGVDCGFVNAIGLANPGVEVFAEELKEFLEETKREIPLIVSIFADSPVNFAKVAERLDSFSFMGYELNLSCPHVKDVGSEIGTDIPLSSKVISSVKDVTKKAVFAKMPATINNVLAWGRAMESAGADGIVAINTIRAMAIDIQSRKPILSNKIGGLSGNAIRPVGVRAVYELYDAIEIPIVGVGGVSTWNHAMEYFLAGATCVQVGSAMSKGFLGSFEEINQGVSAYLQKNGYSKLQEVIGTAHD
jgi:dihydroorotate dehydrogenase (NAD+) catalytic subunit